MPGTQNMVMGVGWAVLGLVITGATYAIAPGGYYVVAYGAVVAGGFQFVTGLSQFLAYQGKGPVSAPGAAQTRRRAENRRQQVERVAGYNRLLDDAYRIGLERRWRFRGCLLGLAVGDAVGASPEFRRPGAFEPGEDRAGGGPFGLGPGQWTDDTSMALCLAESLIERRGFDAIDQLCRYTRWWREGHNTSTGACFDIGNTVRRALAAFEETGEPYPGPTDEMAAGNGSITRLAPVPMFYSSDPEEAIRRAAESSRTTHGARIAIDACRYMAGLIIGALNGASKEEILSERYCPVEGLWEREPLADQIDEIAAGSFRRRHPPEIRDTGHVAHSLEAALWALEWSSNFEEGCLAAVIPGHDGDTTGAVYGQIAGALYGPSGIPKRWREKVWEGERLAALADRLAAESFRRTR